MAKTGKDSEIVSSNVPKWVHAWFKGEAKRLNRTMSVVIGEVLSNYVRRQTGESVAEPLAPYGRGELKLSEPQLRSIAAMLRDLAPADVDPALEPDAIEARAKLDSRRSPRGHGLPRARAK